MKKSIVSFLYSSLAVGGMSFAGWVVLVIVSRVMTAFGI